MARSKTLMSEKVKHDGGWGNVSAKDCGSMVAKAIEIANRKA